MGIIVLSFAAALALIFVNGVLVAAEFAIVRVRRTRLEELAGKGKEDAVRAIALVDEMGQVLTTTQVGITAASLGVGWLGEDGFAHLLMLALPASSGALVHAIATGLAFALVTMLHVVLGEIVPKNFAIARADRALLVMVGPLRVLHRALGPITRLFMATALWVQRRLGDDNPVPSSLSEEELKLLLTNSHEDGVLTEGEATIILRAFEFADASAREIMVPAERVRYLSLSRTFEENLETAREHVHARYPLCDTDLDTARGIVGLKDLALVRGKLSNEALERVCRPLTKIPHDLSQEDILRRLQADGTHMGVVRNARDDETLGVVTLEDVVASLVGDVRESPLPGEAAPSEGSPPPASEGFPLRATGGRPKAGGHPGGHHHPPHARQRG